LLRSALSTASTAWFNPHFLPVNAGLPRWQLNQVLADSQASYVAVHSEAVNLLSFGNSIAVIPSGSQNNGSQLPVVFASLQPPANGCDPFWIDQTNKFTACP
jgi:hypothetical protein